MEHLFSLGAYGIVISNRDGVVTVKNSELKSFLIDEELQTDKKQTEARGAIKAIEILIKKQAEAGIPIDNPAYISALNECVSELLGDLL